MSGWRLLVADRSKFKRVRYSKAVSEARRAALSAIRAAQIRDLERAQADVRDLQRLLKSLEHLDQVDDWFQQRLVKLQAEAEARRDRHRADAGRAVASPEGARTGLRANRGYGWHSGEEDPRTRPLRCH